jgi:hypothetical protein
MNGGLKKHMTSIGSLMIFFDGMFETQNSNAVDRKFEGATGDDGVNDGRQYFDIGCLIT